MPHFPRRALTRVLVATAAVGLLACQDSPTTPSSDDVSAALAVAGGAVTSAGLSAEHNAQLAQLRRFIAPFHQLDRAMAAGYNVEVTPCLELAGQGGMGFHYGNPNFINNAVANLLEPELLLYEPQKNGRMRLVGVEYIIPFTELPATAPAPTLLGQTFHADPGPQIWALHVWVGTHNPSGIFADWNPTVTCQFAGP